MIANQHIELEDAGHRVVPAFADGLTTLICACSRGSIEVVRLLIANKVDLEARDVGAMTSLIYAVLNGHILIVRFLKSNLNISVVLNSCMYINVIIPIRLLLDKGAQVDGKDKEGMTALLFAAQNGDVDIIKLLLSRNASINVREGKYIFICVDKS